MLRFLHPTPLIFMLICMYVSLYTFGVMHLLLSSCLVV